jgi:hypothetical protein
LLLLSLVTTSEQQNDFRKNTACPIYGGKTYLKNNFLAAEELGYTSAIYIFKGKSSDAHFHCFH